MSTTPPAPITWAYSGQEYASGPNTKGAYGPGYNVSFTLSTGEMGTVFVPAESYTAANVAKVVAAHAAQLAAVSGLSGEIGAG